MSARVAAFLTLVEAGGLIWVIAVASRRLERLPDPAAPAGWEDAAVRVQRAVALDSDVFMESTVTDLLKDGDGHVTSVPGTRVPDAG